MTGDEAAGANQVGVVNSRVLGPIPGGDESAHGSTLRRVRDTSLSPYRRAVPRDVEVRPIRPADFATAGEVTALAFREFAPPESGAWAGYLARIGDVAGRAQRTQVLVAVSDGEIVGSATIELDRRVELDGVDPPAADEAHLRMLGVHPAHRRQGIARALVLGSIAVARSAGRHRLTLETGAPMRAARAMYVAMGFVPTGSREVQPGLWFHDFELRIDS